MSEELIQRLRVAPTASHFLKPAHLYQDWIAERSEAADYIEEQSARIAELERDRDASVNCERDLMQSILQSHTLNDLHAVRETVKAIMEADANGSK